MSGPWCGVNCGARMLGSSATRPPPQPVESGKTGEPMKKVRASLSAIVLVLGAGLAISCSSEGTKQAATQPPAQVVAKIDGPAMSVEKPVDMAGLHNVVAYHEGYWSGSV